MSDAPQLSGTPQVSKDEQNWTMICHLSALAGFLIPFGNIVGPLIVWLIKRAEMPMVEIHGKEAVNFQITVSIAMLVCIVLMLVLVGFLLALIVGLSALVLTVVAAVKVSNGNYDYRYPLTIRLLK